MARITNKITKIGKHIVNVGMNPHYRTECNMRIPQEKIKEYKELRTCMCDLTKFPTLDNQSFYVLLVEVNPDIIN